MSLRSADLSLPQGILKDKDVSELEKLQEDEAHFIEFFSALELDSMAKMKAERAAIVESVRNLALETSNLKPDYESKKSRLVDSSIQGQELRHKYDQQYEELKKLIGSSDKEDILRDLQESVKVSEQQAEDCIEDFLAGKTEQCIEDLIQNYLQQRTLYWLRKVKSEKLMEINRQPEPPASRPYPPPSASQPSGGPPPYPSDAPSSAQPTPYGSYPSQHQPGYSPGNPAQRMPTPQPRYTQPTQSIPGGQPGYPGPTQSISGGQPGYPGPTQSISGGQPGYPGPTQSIPGGQPGYPAPTQSIPSTRPGYHPAPVQSVPSTRPSYPGSQPSYGAQSYTNRPPYPQQQQPGHSLQGMAAGYGYPGYSVRQQGPPYPQQQQRPQYPSYPYQHKR